MKHDSLFIKPEVHNGLQRRLRRIETQAQATVRWKWRQVWVTLCVWTLLSYARTDRRTDRQTDLSQYAAVVPGQSGNKEG